MRVRSCQILCHVGLRSVHSNRRWRQLFVSSTMLAGLASAGHAGAPLPVGGSVAQGNAKISSGLDATTVNQSSSRAVINWQSFDVAAGKAVVFNQPDAQSATLNRVTGNTTSTIAGQITSNGAVYLINPNGIAITSTGSVNTAGGFVASTLDIADGDFMAGNLKFAGSGASNTVTNAGHINANQGAYVALLGGAVSNSGTINVPYGKVGLGSGESIALDLNGNGFMQVAVPSALLTGSNALIDNSGSITASGGTVQLQAAVVKDAIRNVINMSGSINADSATGDGGTIHLIGGADTANMAGTVTVSGTLTAQATGASGNGGAIETSGEHLNLNGIAVSTASANGTSGNWLLDPVDLTVAASGGDITGAALSAALNAGSVTLVTSATVVSATGATLTGSGSSGNGDININDAVSWTSGNVLTLTAYNNISITAPITAPAGTLWLAPGQVVAGMGLVTDTASVSVYGFYLNNGTWSQSGAILPSFSAKNFTTRVTGSTFLRVTGGDGTTGNPYQIADVYGLQGVGSNALLGSNFVLANDIDASVTATWVGSRDLKGFRPIGEDGYVTGGSGLSFTGSERGQIGAGFTGSFNGQGHTISNLTINIRNTNPNTVAGLFLTLGTGASISNLNLANEAVSGTRYNSTIGGLVATMNDGTVNHVTVGGTVGTSQIAGGLAGQVNGGTITNSSSSATVSSTGGTGRTIGGLIGILSNGTVSNSYATGSVTLSGGTNPPMEGGGLIGWMKGGTLTQSWASGRVTTDFFSGGLIGYMTAGTVSQVYALGSVATNHGAAAGGLVGEFDGGSIDQAYASGYTSITGGTNGGALIGAGSAQAITNSYWDNYSTLQANPTGAGGSAPTVILITSDPTKSTAANYSYTASTYANFSAASGIGTATPTGWVFVPGNSTRPMLASEVPTAAVSGTDASGNILVKNDHQLQLIGYNATTLSANYSLGANIDLTATGAINPASTDPYAFATYTGIWAATGFSPIGTSTTPFSGSFNGQNYTITNLTISRPAQSYVGLFGDTNNATISNLGVVGGSVSGRFYVGDLVGVGASGSITNAYATGNVTGSGGPVGGLAGQFSGSISNSYATGNVSSPSYYVGGLVGLDIGSISNSYATGTVTESGTGFYVGGLVGAQNGGSISGAYATGVVSSASNFVGGLVGSSLVTVSYTYATGNVSGGNNVGGLIGENKGTIQQSYAIGAVSGAANVGGVIGVNQGTGRVASDYWDSYASGTTTAIGINLNGAVGAVTDLLSVTSDPAQSAAANYAFKASTYANLLKPNWFLLDGVRPLLTFQADSLLTPVNGAVTVSTPLQIALIGADTKTLSQTYTLSSNVVFAGGGLIGTDGSGNILNGGAGFSGTFNGGGFTISGLSINSTAKYAGLFGYSTGNISNLTVSGTVTSTANFAGGLVGYQLGGSISNITSSVNVSGFTGVGGIAGSARGINLTNSSASGTISGANEVGGLAGEQVGGVWSGVTSTASVTGTGAFAGGLVGVMYGGSLSGSATGAVSGALDVGGLVGYEQGSGSVITGASSSGATITGTSNVGGLVGYAEGSITGSSSSDAVVGVSYVGGLAGRQAGGSITNASASGSVTGGSAAGGQFVGGLIGYQDAAASITGSMASGSVSTVAASGPVNFVGGLVGDAMGNITNSSASGAVGSSVSNYVGGLVGYQSGAAILTSRASGTVTGATSTGGLVGYTVSGSIDQSYATGAVSGSGSYAGGLIGLLSSGTVSNVYSTGAVNGSALYLGGLVGYQLGGSITQAYAIGAVGTVMPSVNAKLGGLIGYQQAGSLTNALWDTQMTGMSMGFGYHLAGATFTGTGLTTLQAQDFSSYATTYPGLDFTNIWNAPNQAGQNGQATAAYPTLRNRP